MPAAVRGGGRSAAKPRAKGPQKSAKPRVAKPAREGASKLRAAKGAGVSPTFALVAVAAVMTAGIAVALATGDRAQKLSNAAAAAVTARAADVGFRVKAVHLQGASKSAQDAIIAAADLRRDQPLLGVDLTAVRERVERVGWVKRARVIRLYPDTIVIAIDERRLLAVWQRAGRVNVIDGDGAVVPEADPGQFAKLPLIVGQGANTAAASILPSLAARPHLVRRLEALVRVDDRRWDLRLKDGALVQLPATEEEAALIRLDQLEAKSRILELGFARVDLRDPEMVAVRPREIAAPRGAVADGV
jgi:cell division protein FtsQ